MASSVKQILADPEFKSFTPDEQRSILASADPEAANFTDQELIELTGAPRQLKPSTQQTLAEQQALRQQIIQQAQKPGLSKAIEGVFGIGGAIASPFISFAKGVGAIPEVVAEPSRIPATLAESGKRLGLDLVQLAEMLRPKTATQAAFGPGGGLGAALIEGMGNLRSYTPTEQQIQEQLLAQEETRPFQEALQQERDKVAFKGAQPELAEGINQAVQIAVPSKAGINLLKSGATGIESVPRMIRSAIKPTKANVGAKIEKAATEEMSDIFKANPNADRLSATPMEGFANEIKTAFTNAGIKIGELRKLSGTALSAGDEIADKILEKAVALEASGQPKAIVDELVDRANDIRGKMTDINSLQEAVTIANRKPNIMKPKTTAEGFADEIISKDGGSLINKELESIGGPEAATLRKKWSNLKTLSENVDERVNKIINNAPEAARPALLDTLASPEGVAGVFALVHGWTLPGAIALGSKLVKNWAKNEIKDLKNSNSIIERTYDTLRKESAP